MAAPRVILQSDFHTALTEHEGRAWVIFKNAGRESIHSHLEKQGHTELGLPYVVASEGFSVGNVTTRSMEISYAADTGTVSRTFVAPADAFQQIHKRSKSVYCLDVTSGGLGVSSDTDGQLNIWETQTGNVRRELKGHLGDVYTCKFFPSGVVLLTGGADMQLKIWSAETGKCAATLHGHRAGILDSAIIDRGRNVVSCGRDGTVRLWDCSTQACMNSIENCGGIINCCAIQTTASNVDLGTPDGNPHEKEVGTEGKLLLVGCENKTLQGYGLLSRKKVFELDCHDAVNCCCFISDTCVACGTQDGHITVTDVRNVRVPVREWKESRNAMLSMLPYKSGFFTSTGDGSCFYSNQNYETRVELCGSDCDPLYKTVSDGSYIYTACRDSFVRKYSVHDIATS